MKSYNHPQQGFTLVELAIVLVIIGLIVGGVLVGQDMIKAAQVRATVGQVEKYNSAVNTFRTRFNGMPGDLLSAKAASFSMVARSGADAHGDGDGWIEGCDSSDANAPGSQGCETILFWRDLSFAGLIDNSFTSASDATAADLDNTVTGNFFPLGKIGRSNDFVVFSTGGMNYYELGDVTATDSDGIPTYAASITPSEAFNMDNKIDDGMPLTGSVTALEGTTMNNAAVAAVPAAGVCVSNAVTPNPYNTKQAAGADYSNTMACQLRFRVN